MSAIYYLYYQLQMQNTTSVAVAEHPEGPYEYYGVVKHPDGRPYGLKKDAYNFDPGVLLDDDGKVYMYTGFSPDSGFLRFLMERRGGTYKGGSVVELEPDMLTLASREVPTIPGKLYAAGTQFAEHPLGPWTYGGTLVSNGDIGLPGITEKNAKNFIGNTHGGMVCVKGQWYIFYHRQTNQQMCARPVYC